MTMRVVKCTICGYRFRADPEQRWKDGEGGTVRIGRTSVTEVELVPAEYGRTVDLYCPNCEQEFEVEVEG